jgi:hypothetical protein
LPEQELIESRLAEAEARLAGKTERFRELPAAGADHRDEFVRTTTLANRNDWIAGLRVPELSLKIYQELQGCRAKVSHLEVDRSKLQAELSEWRPPETRDRFDLL